MTQTVTLKVRMSCEGCSGAVKRVLGKMEGIRFVFTISFCRKVHDNHLCCCGGVESFDIDMEQQKVTVIGNVQPDAVFETVSKTGKKTAFWEEETAAPAEAEVKPAEVKPAEAAATATATA